MSIMIRWVLSFFFLGLGIVFVRTLLEAQASYQRATNAELASDIDSAIEGYRGAIRWRFPFSPYFDSSVDRLSHWALDVNFPHQHKALEGLRQGIMSSRSVFTFRSDTEVLDDLREMELQVFGTRQVEEINPPRWLPHYQFFAQIFLWSWVCLMGCVAFSGFSSDGSVLARPLLSYFSLAVVSFSLWLYFLSLA